MTRDTAKPPLLIFDCDGVLVDSEPIASRVLAEALSEIGFPLGPQQAIERYTGISLAAVLAAVEAEWQRPLPADFSATLAERDRAAFRAELQAMPGVARVLAGLPHARCVASSGSLDKIRHNLALTGLLDFFAPHVFSAEMVTHGKPAPDLFLLAAARMHSPPARCVVIEDSVAGVSAACAAGMRVLGFCGGGHARPELADALRAAGAREIFTRMSDLPALLAG